MIEEKGGLVVRCDGVGCEAFVGSASGCELSSLVEAAKVEGWVVRKDATGWSHWCPDCVEAA
jgi:hypothetical protein